MKISIIIPTTNRKEELSNSIEAYLKQTYQNFEILIMDNASKDGTKELFENNYSKNEKIKFFYFEENLFFTAFNIGVWNSTGDVIWVCDDDSNPRDNNTFERIVKIFNDYPDIHIIGTENIDVNSGNKVWNWHSFDVDKLNVPQKGYKTNSFYGTGAAIKKEVFKKIGGFWGFGFEENDFSTRAIVAGYNLRYFPNIVTLHYNSKKMRIPKERWLHMTTQFVKYHFKYYYFWNAFFKIFLSMHFEIAKAIYFRFNPIVIITAILSWSYHSLFMRYNNFTPIPKDKLYDVTLGNTPNKYLINFLKHKFSKK